MATNGGSSLELCSNAGISAMNAGLFVSPGYGFHQTRTLDTYELIFVLSGELALFEAEHSFFVPSGHVLLLTPGLQHGGITPFESGLQFYWVHFFVDSTTGNNVNDPYTAQLAGSSRSFVDIPKTAAVPHRNRIEELFRRFVSDQESGFLSGLIANEILILMLCEIARQTGGVRNQRVAFEENHPYGVNDAYQSAQHGAMSPRGRKKIVEAVQQQIAQNFAHGASTSSIAKTLDLHPDYLERVYRSETGERITVAMNRARIDAACTMLHEEPALNINEIAVRCGFRDSSYFHRVFRRLTGMTPRQLRRLYSPLHINSH